MKKSYTTPQMTTLGVQPMAPLCASNYWFTVTSAKGGDELSNDRISCDYDDDDVFEYGSLW